MLRCLLCLPKKDMSEFVHDINKPKQLETELQS